MQYRLFQAQIAWQERYTAAIPSTPSTPTVFKSVPLHAAYTSFTSTLSPSEDASDNTADHLFPQHPLMTLPLPHPSNPEHCLLTSAFLESDTASSGSSSDSSILATPNPETSFSSWDALSPSGLCRTSTPLSPCLFYNNTAASPIFSEHSTITAPYREHNHSQNINADRVLPGGNILDDGGAFSPSRPILRRRHMSKEIPKRVLQNREKSKRYYYRRKAQHAASNDFLSSRKDHAEPTCLKAELEEPPFHIQFIELDGRMFPLPDVVRTPNSLTGFRVNSKTEQNPT